MKKTYKPLSQKQLRKYVNEHLDDMVSEAMAWHKFMEKAAKQDKPSYETPFYKQVKNMTVADAIYEKKHAAIEVSDKVHFIKKGEK